MQSQQKRVKWSRGETAEALEERTDTGITSASVELMENCIPDIYGNISRRPGISLIKHNDHSFGFWYDQYLQVIPFYITETDIVLVGIHYSTNPEFIRIKDGVISVLNNNTSVVGCSPLTRSPTASGYEFKKVSFSQQNNYMLIADAYNVYKMYLTFDALDVATPHIDVWKFSADWYAPGGTQTKTETDSTIPGLMFSGDAQNYTYTDNAGNSTVYTSLPTGLKRSHGYAIWTAATTTWYFGKDNYGVYSVSTTSLQQNLASWTMVQNQVYDDGQQLTDKSNYDNIVRLTITSAGNAVFDCKINDGTNNFVLATTEYCTAFMTVTTTNSWTDITTNIPAGSIVMMPNIGCYFRAEGYFSSSHPLAFPGVMFDKVATLQDGDPLPAGYTSGAVCVARTKASDPHLEYYQDGALVSKYPESTSLAYDTDVYIRCITSLSDSNQKSGWFHYDNGAHFVWESSPYSLQNIFVYGSLLTPIADSAATDSTVSVEYGYVSLQPASWDSTQSFPHPLKLAFSSQRLWAGSWAMSASQKERYSITIGSQIGRYNDLKNDYNQENEAITVDIFTQFKEEIVHLIDYNGLKIMTNSYEYAYDATNGVVKQSANGSLENCEPIIFDSLCLYIDSTGNQVKAMQYEFQSNIFNSSTINQVAPHDLIWQPFCMASYEDKTNSTGKYLFLVNEDTTEAPRVAVCNFVPSNQANIWNRWSFPKVKVGNNYVPFIHSVVQTKLKPIFMVTMQENGNSSLAYVYPAHIDWNASTDAEGFVYVRNNVNYYCAANPVGSVLGEVITLSNTLINVYSNGEFQFTDTTTSTGALTKSIEGLTNVTVGLPINSTIVSHPIDVGGKTKSIKKRIGKARMSVHGTEADVITINGKTGYMNPAKDQISFYGVTGMKNEIKYTITNKNGGMFHLESLLMNIEYGTLDS